MRMIFIWLLTACSIISPATAQYAMVSGEITDLKKDSVSIALLHNQVTRDIQIIRLGVVNRQFKAKIYVPQAVYFAITDDKNYTHGVLQPGDDIRIQYNFEDKAGTLLFSGKGAEKSTFFQHLAVLKKDIRESISPAQQQALPIDYFYHRVDSFTANTFQQLETIRSTMNNDSYALLYAHITGIRQSNKYRSIGQLLGISHQEAITGSLTPSAATAMKSLLQFNESMHGSYNYVSDVYNILIVHYSDSYAGKGLQAKYDTLTNALPPLLRAPVLTMFLQDDIKALNGAIELDSLVDKVYGTGDDQYKQYTRRQIALKRKFIKGMTAPDFSLENDKGELVTLSAFKGKVVHIDFWFEACVPCQDLFIRLKPLKEQYAGNKDIVFLCVSIDEKGVWKKAKEKIHAVHLYTNNKGRVHPVIRDYNIDGYPTTYIIGKDGRIFDDAPSGYLENLQSQLEAALKE